MRRINSKPLTIAAAAIVFVCSSVTALAQQTAQARSPQTHPKEFDSPDQAAKALIDAASRNDKTELTTILGSSAQGVLTSGDPAKDQEDRKEFSTRAAAKNHIEHSSISSSAAVLLVGEEDWPFPIPLVRTGQRWHFDAELGAVEMAARRIGANEMDAIETCEGYVDAQKDYNARTHAYAQKIMSSPGQKDGLYQPGTSPDPVPAGFATASAAAPAGARKPYHGYYFRVLQEQGPNAPGGAHKYVAGGSMMGGFALLAWPAEYGATGIHTFIVSHDGVVFEKDLGSRTASVALTIIRYDPDSSWSPVN